RGGPRAPGPAGGPAGTAPSVLRPYVLPPFDVRVDPSATSLCTNFAEYTSQFGPFSADDPNAPPGTALYPGHRTLTHAVYGFFKNGGTRCFVARVKAKTAPDPNVRDIP